MRKKLWWFLGCLGASGLLCPALALETSVGIEGIDARRLHQAPYNLTGRKISIGQVEIGRPAKFGLDKTVSWSSALSLAGLYHRDSPAKANAHVDEHAAMVATVMVSQDKKLRGVAPGAKLYASAIGPLQQGGQPEECLSSQHVALQNSGDVRAINYSFGESLQRDPRPDAALDGQALLTLCVDWSARVHNTLYVVAGNQGSGGIPIPTDNFNGVNTAYTTKRDNKFSKVDFANLSDSPTGIGRRLIARETNNQGRRSIDLVAPGSKIAVYDLEGRLIRVTGTSFAAPHVTGTVALLQEYGDRQLAANSPNWSTASRRHEVMKAVLLNSADKLQDQGDGLLLGMSRTILSKDNRTWLEGKAYKENKIPLDIQMGTGHLNAFRAYQQFSAGQWSPDTPVPTQGWDYGEIEAVTHRDYLIQDSLIAGSFAAVTLTWNRLVELEDRNGNDLYDLRERFSDRGLNDLNVYLLPADGEDKEAKVCASVSKVDSVEHIFCPIPSTGRYKIRVSYEKQVNEATQPYALAWWTVSGLELQ